MPAGIGGFISFHIPRRGIFHNGHQHYFMPPVRHFIILAAAGGISFCLPAGPVVS
jgi:hypothetical protein